MRPLIPRAILLLSSLGALACSSSPGAASPHDGGTPDGATGPADAGGDVAADAAGDAAAPADAGPPTHANGTVAPWQTLAPMPVSRANHCSVVASGYLVVLGGNFASGGGFTNTDAVNVAPLNGDGTVGAWTQAGTTPSPVSSCTAATDGSTVYLVDGIFDDPTKGSQVWAAALSTTGTLGAWASLGPLPSGDDLLYSEAWVQAGTLYGMDSKLPDPDGGPGGDVIATLRATLGSGLGPWAEDDWLPGFRGHPEYAFTGAFVYVIGGYGSADAGNPMLATVSGAPVGASGVGAAFSTQALPKPTGFGRAVAIDGYVFVVGGKGDISAGGQPDVVSAKVHADGTLNPWATETPLPAGRTSLALAASGDYLYVTGGGGSGPGLDTVYSARVRF